MSWRYEQATGHLYRPDGSLAATGYSGCPECRNDPTKQTEHERGPIPRGTWSISNPFNSPEHGPMAMRLTPAKGTDTFGRDGFLIHGDSRCHPGAASKGCIIVSRPIRYEISISPDSTLEVI